ncbi:class I SAM-dependent methyltransferase [Candidatus Laterigemmans baculatus]|uniref:class I SAM-dependent methyltransferase n=1 Tax=Candidatus Laterigemmans baculatus TaxID=2770505 RepID=UPI0013DCCB1A|nr:methyltransferase [Candidatus Laterigemmans baculatus]
MSDPAATNEPADEPLAPPIERLALEAARRVFADHQPTAPRVLASSTSRGQTAAALAQAGADVTLLELEDFRAALLRDWLGEGSPVRLVCDTDPPAEPKFELAILPVRRDGGAELARDLLQGFIAALEESGTLIAVADHPNDSWLGDQLRALADAKAIRRYQSGEADAASGATAYVVRRSDIRLRVRDFSCEFAFRDSGRLIRAFSRPGVFSHRRLDLGARRLIDAMQIAAGDRVVDIGCGAGVVALAAALRAADVQVTAIDSATRAIECTRRGAKLNGLEDRITAILSSDGSVPESGSYDVAVANPPYFAHFRIAELFLQAAQTALRPGGQLWIVGKQPDWYQSNVPRWFDRVKLARTGGGYCIATGIRPNL